LRAPATINKALKEHSFYGLSANRHPKGAQQVHPPPRRAGSSVRSQAETIADQEFRHLFTGAPQPGGQAHWTEWRPRSTERTPTARRRLLHATSVARPPGRIDSRARSSMVSSSGVIGPTVTAMSPSPGQTQTAQAGRDLAVDQVQHFAGRQVPGSKANGRE
jgi:hypothetical protein